MGKIYLRQPNRADLHQLYKSADIRNMKWFLLHWDAASSLKKIVLPLSMAATSFCSSSVSLAEVTLHHCTEPSRWGFCLGLGEHRFDYCYLDYFRQKILCSCSSLHSKSQQHIPPPLSAQSKWGYLIRHQNSSSLQGGEEEETRPTCFWT